MRVDKLLVQKRSKSILGLVQTKDQIFDTKNTISADILQNVERMMLDRKTLFQEKVDVLLKEKEDASKIDARVKRK